MKDSDADKLKAEIERLKDEYTDIAIDSHYGTVNANHVVDDLEQLLSFLSTLESEEPRTIFSQKVFEQYDREQFINACEEPVGEELEKAALEYETDNTIQTYDGGGLTPMAVVGLAEAFEAGANWQKQHDSELIEIAYNDGITIGKTKQKEQDEKEQADLFTIVALDAAQRAKEQMLKEAVEGVVCYGSKGAYIETDFLGEYNTDVYGNPGDKVRVIVLPKEDEK